MFPGYVFCLFGSDVLGPIVTTPGVIRILGVGNTPVAISESEIEAIRTVVTSGVSVGPSSYFQNGELVRVSEGPLCGIGGQIVGLGKNNFLILSVTLLQRSIALEISPYSVIRIDPRKHKFSGHALPVSRSVLTPCLK